MMRKFVRARLKLTHLRRLIAPAILLALSPAARADVTGALSEFASCPTSFATPAGDSLICSHSETTGGQLVIGNSTVTIANNPDTVDLGAYGSSFFSPEAIVTPTNGQVFGGPAQEVPGGLLGLTGALAPLSKPLDPINEVTSSIELAGTMTPNTVVDPAATNAFFCATGPLESCIGTASPASVVTVPIKVHLHNFVLGPNCYIGSNSNPIRLNLQETPSSTPQLGGAGNAIIVSGIQVADNTFAVPGASGCGLGGILDPVLNAKVGLPSASGKNSALIDEDGELESADFICQERNEGDSAPCN